MAVVFVGLLFFVARAGGLVRSRLAAMKDNLFATASGCSSFRFRSFVVYRAAPNLFEFHMYTNGREERVKKGVLLGWVHLAMSRE